MKAYKDTMGRIRMFRPDLNMVRMNRSAARIGLPTFNGDEFLACIKELIKLESRCEQSWLLALIRPTFIATQPSLGVGPTDSALLYVICSPVGPYYKSGFNP